MDNFKVNARRGLDYILWSGFIAFLTVFYYIMYGYGTFFDSLLMVYFWNFVGIFAFLLVDKLRIKRIYKKLSLCRTDEARKKLSKKDVSSTKTCLYIFYVFSLIGSHVLSLAPELAASEDVHSYFQVTGRGLILLFAVDMLLKCIADDTELLKKFKAECQGNDDSIA